MGLQQFARDIQIVGVGNAQKHDRQIAGNAERPEPRLRSGATQDRLGRRTQGRVGVDHVTGQTLEQAGLAGRDAEVMQLHLRLRPGEGRGARKSCRVAMPVDNVEQGFARRGRHRPEGNARHGARRDPHAAAQGENRVEHGADRVGQFSSVAHGDRRPNALPASQKARAVGLDFGLADGFSIDDGELADPDFRLARIAAAPCGDKRADFAQKFRLDKKLGKSRVGDIRRLWGEHKFGIGGDFDFANARAGVRHRDAPHFGVVLGGNHDIQSRRQHSVLARELGAILVEGDMIIVGFATARLKARGPDLVAVHIAQKDIGAEIIAGRVFAPAGQGEFSPAAVAGARAGQHRGIKPVGKQVRRRGRLMRGGITSAARWFGVAPFFGRGFHFRRPGTDDGDLARHALLQQEFGRLHHRLGVKPRPHLGVERGIGDGDDGHALMVGHESAHDGALFAFRHTCRGVIQRLVKAVTAERADAGEALQIGARRRRIDHGRQAGRIRRDDEIVGQSAFQPEAGNAEVGILVGQFQIARIIGRFRNAPGQTLLVRKGDLSPHGQAACRFEQTSRRRPHDQRRHQIFEHRSRPGDQRGAMSDRGRRAAKLKPVAGGKIALGDGEKTRQPRFGGQKVVAVGVERALCRQIADREEVALAVHEKAELHGHRHRTGDFLQFPQPQFQVLGGFGVARKVGAMRRDGVHRGLRPEQHVRASLVAALAGQRPRHIEHRLSLEAEICKPGPEIVHRRKRLARGQGERAQRIVELPPGDGLRLAAVTQARRVFPGQVERVGDPFEASLSFRWRRSPFPAGIGQGDQVPGKIAAIDRRHIFRVERAQVAGVVPIVEMAAETLHAAHGRQSGLKPFDRFLRSKPSEVAGAGQREEVEAEIGRGCAMRHFRRGILLKIVGRQHVVGAGDEGLEEAPGAARGQPQGLRVVTGQGFSAGATRRQADPARHGGRRQPERRESARQQRVPASVDPADDHGQRADHQSASHAAIIAGHIEAPASWSPAPREPIRADSCG